MAGTTGQFNSAGAGFPETFNHALPPEGSRAIPALLDFTTFDSYLVDFGHAVQQARISFIQSVFIDLSNSDVGLTLLMQGTNQIIQAKARTQGYYQVLAPNPPQFLASCVGGPLVAVFFCNVPIPGTVWASQ